MKIMVRKNELACRDEWSHSLFEPGTYVPGDQPLQVVDRSSDPIARPALAPAAAVDIVVGEARIVDKADAPWRKAASQTLQVRVSEERIAIQRAREAYRQRKGQPQRATVQATSGFPFAPQRDEPVDADVVAPLNELLPDSYLANDSQEPVAGLPEAVDVVIPSGWEKDWETEIAVEPLTEAERHELASASEQSIESPIWVQASAFEDTVNIATVAEGWTSAIQAQIGGTPAGEQWNAVDSAGVAEHFHHLGSKGAAEAANDDPQGPGVVGVVTDGVLPPRSVIQDAVAAWTGPAIEGIRIAEIPEPIAAAHLPRCCRTCRDFRPGDRRDFGWCANTWAFTHRHLVEPDGVVACLSAIGSWWVPTDDVALALGDVSSHGSPTPFVDRWLSDGDREERVAERKPS